MIDLRLDLNDFKINGLEIPNIYRDFFSKREEVPALSYKKLIAWYRENGIDLNLWERRSVDYIGFEFPSEGGFPRRLFLLRQGRELELRQQISEKQLADFLGAPEERDQDEKETLILYQFPKYELEFEMNAAGDALRRVNLIQREPNLADEEYDRQFFSRWKIKMAIIILVNLLFYGWFVFTYGVTLALLSALWPALCLVSASLMVRAGETGYNSFRGRERAGRNSSPSKFWSCVDGRLLISCLGMCLCMCV